MNTIIAIGFLGGMNCYLNVPREEAMQRHIKDGGDPEDTVQEFAFHDEFEVYDIWLKRAN